MQLNEDENCFGKYVRCKLQINLTFHEILHVNSSIIACMTVSVYGIQYMDCSVLANFKISLQIN